MFELILKFLGVILMKNHFKKYKFIKKFGFITIPLIIIGVSINSSQVLANQNSEYQLRSNQSIIDDQNTSEQEQGYKDG